MMRIWADWAPLPVITYSGGSTYGAGGSMHHLDFQNIMSNKQNKTKYIISYISYISYISFK